MRLCGSPLRPPVSTTSRCFETSIRAGSGSAWPERLAHTRSAEVGGVSTDTRSSQAQRVSRTALDTERQGRLLHAARAHPSPGHAVQLASQAPPPLRYRPGASQPEMRRRRECGSSEVAGPRGGRAHLLDRRPGRHLSEHVGEALPALGRLDSPPRHIRSSQATWHDQTASSPSVATRPRRLSEPLRGLPGASAACRPALPSPARPAPCRPSPVRQHTHISVDAVEHESARCSPQRRPGGTTPAASRCT